MGINTLILSLFLCLCLLNEWAQGTKYIFERKTKTAHYKLSHGLSLKQGLTPEEKQAILDLTNALRHKIASGHEKHSADGLAPKATNMMAVEWDDVLAEFAQQYANNCPTEHSDLNVANAQYTTPGKADIGENMFGPIVTVFTDMYGEIKYWSYAKQECLPGKQCGHYGTLVSWANFRMGCGYKACKAFDGITMRQLAICEFAPYRAAGLGITDDQKRYKHMYEYMTNLKPGPVSDFSSPVDKYASTEPCSECPQGWDYCMENGLCATKAQCESDPNNKCKCLNDRATCEGNGGKFDDSNCRCACPANKYGINCANQCENTPKAMVCGSDCGNSMNEIFLCHDACGSCGKAVSRGYKYWVEDRKAQNKDNIKVRITPPGPATPIPKGVKTSSLPDRGQCKNIEDDYLCEEALARKFCTDALDGAQWKHYCAASCNSCGNKEWAKRTGISEDDSGVTDPPEGWSSASDEYVSGDGY